MYRVVDPPTVVFKFSILVSAAVMLKAKISPIPNRGGERRETLHHVLLKQRVLGWVFGAAVSSL